MSDSKGLPVVKSPSRNTSDADATKLMRVTRDGMLLTDYLQNLAFQGRIYTASDADENDVLTSVATYAATTPIIVVDVPSGTTAIPLAVNLRQNVGGTLASAPITVALSIETAKIRYSNGGTAETNIISRRTDRPVAQKCSVYSTPTAAAAGTAVAIFHDVITPEITQIPAEGGRWWFDWPVGIFIPSFLVGPASFLVFAYGTNSPTFSWSVSWCEIPSSDLN